MCELAESGYQDTICGQPQHREDLVLPVLSSTSAHKIITRASQTRVCAKSVKSLSKWHPELQSVASRQMNDGPYWLAVWPLNGGSEISGASQTISFHLALPFCELSHISALVMN